MKSIEIISYWEELKKLINSTNIYAEIEVNKIDTYLKEKVNEELNGKSSN